jgi:enamine deaminase RidA (YjgF/YER057c/UK114 family)
MAGEIDDRLRELGITLPAAAAPAANYVPWVATGGLVFVSGQLPILDGEVRFKGHLGAGIDIDDGYQAARVCGLNLIAQMREACAGDLDRVVRVVKVGGFVASAPDFTDQPKVVNGVSDLMAEVFAERGRHARFAVGCPSLPLGAAVEVDGIFEIAI